MFVLLFVLVFVLLFVLVFGGGLFALGAAVAFLPHVTGAAQRRRIAHVGAGPDRTVCQWRAVGTVAALATQLIIVAEKSAAVRVSFRFVPGADLMAKGAFAANVEFCFRPGCGQLHSLRLVGQTEYVADQRV